VAASLVVNTLKYSGKLRGIKRIDLCNSPLDLIFWRYSFKLSINQEHQPIDHTIYLAFFVLHLSMLGNYIYQQTAVLLTDGYDKFSSSGRKCLNYSTQAVHFRQRKPPNDNDSTLPYKQ